jgi:hypothetical protein
MVQRCGCTFAVWSISSHICCSRLCHLCYACVKSLDVSVLLLCCLQLRRLLDTSANECPSITCCVSCN